MTDECLALPRFVPKGRTLEELAAEANRITDDVDTANRYLAAAMGYVIMRPGHPARDEVIEHLSRFGQGCMFGLIAADASPTIH